MVKSPTRDQVEDIIHRRKADAITALRKYSDIVTSEPILAREILNTKIDQALNDVCELIFGHTPSLGL